MLSVHGIYQNGNVILLEKIPQVKQAKVIVTVLEELPTFAPDQPGAVATGQWLGALAGTAQIIGDIVQPLGQTHPYYSVVLKNSVIRL